MGRFTVRPASGRARLPSLPREPLRFGCEPNLGTPVLSNAAEVRLFQELADATSRVVDVLIAAPLYFFLLQGAHESFSYGLPRRLMLTRISCSTSNFVYSREAY